MVMSYSSSGLPGQQSFEQDIVLQNERIAIKMVEIVHACDQVAPPDLADNFLGKRRQSAMRLCAKECQNDSYCAHWQWSMAWQIISLH